MAQSQQNKQSPAPTQGGQQLKMRGGQIAELIQQQSEIRAKVFQNGQLDARAFKNMIYERQAGSITGPKNSLAVAQNASSGDYLEDSLLLHGLNSFGITIEQLCEANLKNLSPNAYTPIEKRFKDQAAFVDKVQENLQSPVVRNLRSIVNVVKNKNFGMQKRAGRFNSPSQTKIGSEKGSPVGSQAQLQVSESARKNLQTVHEDDPYEPMAGVTKGESILHHDSGVPITNSDMSGHMDSALQLSQLMPLNQQSELQAVPEATEHDSDARGSNLKHPFQNYSVPKLNISGLNSYLTPAHASNLQSPHVESTRSPLISALGNLNRSSSICHDSSVARNAMNLSEELNAKLEQNDRYITQTPNIMIQPRQMHHHVSAGNFVIPPQPEDDLATPEEYKFVYNNILRKYQRRNRNGKLLSTDPMELNKLTDQGYQLKAERYMLKRKKKKRLRKQKSMMTGGITRAVRGEPGYASSTESSLTSRSSVSYGGVAEADLEHMESSAKKKKINDRRNDRRASKWKVIFDQVVNVSIKEELSQAMVSNRAAQDNSNISGVALPPNISQGQDGSMMSSEIEPHGVPQQYIFTAAQKNMRKLMDHMEMRLKKRFLEDIDEEIPEEYIRQKEQEEYEAQYRQTSTTQMAATGNSSWDQGAGDVPQVQQLDQIEESIQNMIQSLAEEIEADGDPEAQAAARRAMQNVRPVATTIPSFITNQASFIAGRQELSQRVDKFRKTHTTSPRFYDNKPEQNYWTAKMQTLDRGHIPALLQNNFRAESLHKLASHLRSQNLIPVEMARGQVPPGFNQNMPLDKVTIAVGKHIYERSQSLKAQRQESLAISPLGTSNAMMKIGQGSPSVTSTLGPNATHMLNKTLNQDSDRCFEHSHSNSQVANKSLYNPSQRGRNSDKLMQDVNAVMTFFANNIMLNSDSNEQLDGQQDFAAKRELEDCLTIEKTAAYQDSIGDSQPETELEKKHSLVVCRCNHQAPHRHVYLSPSSSHKNMHGTQTSNEKIIHTVPQSMMIDTQKEMIQEMSQENTSCLDISPMLKTAYHSPAQRREALPQYPSALTSGSNEDKTQNKSTSQNVTPMVYSKQAPRTDHDWNNSEMKNYDDKNTDIQQELNNFKKQVIEVTGYKESNINSDSQQLNSALQAAIDTEEEVQTRNLASQEKPHFGIASRNASAKKGKTYTVLFKSDKLQQAQHAQVQLRDLLESPTLLRVGSQDEKVGQTLESARYLDGCTEKHSPRGGKGNKASRKLHQINIQNQRMNHREIAHIESREHALLSARQLASVSVKNIELPGEYSLSKQQMPQNQRFVDAMNTGFGSAQSLGKDKPRQTAEIALQTSHERLTQQSFFDLQPQIEPAPAVKIPKINFPNTQHRHLMMVPQPMLKQKVSNMTIRNDNQVQQIVALSPSPTSRMNHHHHHHHVLQILDEPMPKSIDETDSSHILIQEIGAAQISQDLIDDDDENLPTSKQPSRAESVRNQRRQQVVLNEVSNDVLKVKGRASNMNKRNDKSSSPSRNNADLTTYKTIDEVTVSKGEASNNDLPRAIYNHDVSHNAEPKSNVEADTDGTAYDENHRINDQMANKLLHELGKDNSRLNNYPHAYDENGNLAYTANVGRINISPMRMRQGQNKNYSLEEESQATNRVVRSFKPSKTKKLPDLAKNHENKLSQLADSNVSPLGLFNQDLHAKREWNKLMAQKNFNATVHDRRMSLSGKFKDDAFMPLSPITDAHRTTHQAMMVAASAKENSKLAASPEQDLTRNNSNAQSGDNNSGDASPEDNSTLQSHTSALNIHRMPGYEKPKIHLMSHNAAQRARKASHQPRKQALHTKVPQAKQKVIVFNFRGNQDLPEEILRRFQMERHQAQQLMESSSRGSKPLLLSNSNIGGSSGIFSPKRNSVNVQDSVSIYTRAKAALQTEAATTRNSRGAPLLSSDLPSLANELQMKEERCRYESTVRKRLNNTDGINPVPQSTSLSTQKFLLSRRQNPSTNNSMASSKVSPFKPMGGGFKQNLAQEVSPQRIEKEVAATREMLKAKQKERLGWNPSRQVSFQTLEQTSFDAYENAPLGFNIEQKLLSRKPSPIREMQDVPEEDNKSYSSFTKDKIGKSMLQLNQQLLDFKPSDLSSNAELDQKSQGQSPYTPHIEGTTDMSNPVFGKNINQDSKSSTDYPLNNNSTMMKNFAVPKAALMPPPVKEAIQTNDSLAFSKIVNQVGSKKKKSQSPNRGSPQRSNALTRRKESSGVPYPLKSHQIGSDTLQGSSFNQSNRFMSSSHMQDATNNGTGMSPPLEGTRMRLSPKMTGQKAPFDQTQDSSKLDDVVIPRKRLSPKTLASIKGGTSQNPIKMDKLASSKLQSDDHTGTHSRMRTASRGMSQNISASRPDLSSQKGYLRGERSLHNRQNSMENLHSPSTPHKLSIDDSLKKRQVVGLLAKDSLKSSVQVAVSREELERTILSSKQTRNLSLLEVQSKLTSMENGMRTVDSREPALMDNPSELRFLHERLQIAEKGIADLHELVSQKRADQNLNEPGAKNQYISSVAGLQLGAQNYRRKVSKKQNNQGLRPNFEFSNDKASASLNRILGNKARSPKGQNRNQFTVHMEALRESEREQTVLGSRDTEVLLNMSTHNRDLQLSIGGGGNITSKKRIQK